MDLDSDTDLESDCCRENVTKLRPAIVEASRHHGKTEERLESTFSSGYISAECSLSVNLDSGISECRTASEENNIPVEGIASLNLEHSSVDEGFDSSEKAIDVDDNGNNSKVNDTNARLVTEVYEQDEDGDTRLHTAIIQLMQDLCLYFIWICNSYKLLNLKNNYLQSPLHLAVLTKQDVVARKLVTSGAQVDSRDHMGNTPLHIACREGYDYFAKILLTPITYLETKGNRYNLPYQQIPQNLEARNYDGQVCLHLAAEKGHIETVDVLLSKGANVNTRDGKSGRTILHYAAESGCVPLLSYLLQQEHCVLDINCTTYSGMTPIMLARGRGQEEVVKALRIARAYDDSDGSSGEEDMIEESYDDVKINGVIVNGR